MDGVCTCCDVQSGYNTRYVLKGSRKICLPSWLTALFWELHKAQTQLQSDSPSHVTYCGVWKLLATFSTKKFWWRNTNHCHGSFQELFVALRAESHPTTFSPSSLRCYQSPFHCHRSSSRSKLPHDVYRVQP